MAIIIPGINTTDENKYKKMLDMAENVCNLIQIDIGDGVFTPTKSLGPETVNKFPSSKRLEIQLMVVHPLAYVKKLVPLPYVTHILFPFESDDDIGDVVYEIKSKGKTAGLSLNPETKVSELTPYLDDIDYMQLLANNPGPSGQTLLETTYDRIKQVKTLEPGIPVEVDIGVNEETIPKLVSAGADLLVSTSAIYGAPDFYVAYEKLTKLAQKKGA